MVGITLSKYSLIPPLAKAERIETCSNKLEVTIRLKTKKLFISSNQLSKLWILYVFLNWWYYEVILCSHIKIKVFWSSHYSTAETNLTSVHEDAGLIPGLMGWGSSAVVSCGVGRRHCWDPTLLWLWHRTAAVASIQLLVWELLCAAGVALKRKKKRRFLSSFISRPTYKFTVYFVHLY